MPISPLVDQPQTKNVNARTQNAGWRIAVNKISIAPRAVAGAAGPISGSSVAPYGSSPTSDGRSRKKIKTIGASTAQKAATVIEALRHPLEVIMKVNSGRNIIDPVA